MTRVTGLSEERIGPLPPPAATEAMLSEVPEHLLERSKAARARLTGADPGGAPATTPAETAPAASAAATAPAAAASTPAPVAAAPEPDTPWVAAAKSRTKIPIWVMPVFAFLPIWAVMYMTTNDPESPTTLGPVQLGEQQYSTCAACHGGGGDGGVGPAFTGGEIIATFPEPGEHVRWVLLGTAGYESEGTDTYGETAKPVGGGGAMPAQDSLDDEHLLAVVRHEREAFGDEEFDQEAWVESITELVDDTNPEVSDRAEAWLTIIEEWPA